jgi:hypothetical protein
MCPSGQVESDGGVAAGGEGGKTRNFSAKEARSLARFIELFFGRPSGRRRRWRWKRTASSSSSVAAAAATEEGEKVLRNQQFKLLQ